MLSGLFSPKTVAHLAVVAATSSCGPAEAVGAESPTTNIIASPHVRRCGPMTSSLVGCGLSSISARNQLSGTVQPSDRAQILELERAVGRKAVFHFFADRALTRYHCIRSCA